MYAVSDRNLCIACGFRRDDHRHFQHIPSNRWPESMRKPRKERVVINGKVYDRDDPRAVALMEPPVVDNQMVYVEPEPLDTFAMLERLTDNLDQSAGAPDERVIDVPEWLKTPDVVEPTGEVVDGVPLVRFKPTPRQFTPVTCDVCGKVCAHAGALAGHKRSHKAGAE